MALDYVAKKGRWEHEDREVLCKLLAQVNQPKPPRKWWQFWKRS